MNTMDAPIRVLSSKEKYQSLWSKPGCIRENVMQVLDEIEECPQVEQVKIMIKDYKDLSEQIERKIEMQ